MANKEFTFENVRKNASAYVFNQYDKPTAPSINVNPVTVDSSTLNEAVDKYNIDSNEYAKNFKEFVGKKEYSKDRLSKDLAASTDYLTSDGVDLQANKITLHKKADNVFDVSYSSTPTNASMVISVIDNYEKINSSICMSDSSDSSALVSEYESAVDYDKEAFVITSASVSNPENTIFPAGISSACFILDNVDGVVIEKKYVNYITSSAAAVPLKGKKVSKKTNEPKFILGFEPSIIVSGVSSATDTVDSVWVIRKISSDVEPGEAVSYIKDNLNKDYAKWTLYKSPRA